MWRQLTVDHRVGRDLLWPRIKSKPEGQKYEPTQIPYYVWGECLLLIQKRMQDGPVRWTISRCTVHWTSFLESMGKQLNSSRIFSQDLQHCRSYKKSRKTWNARTLNKNCSLTKSSSCQCSRYCLDSKKHWRNLRFEFRESKNCTHKDFRKVTGHLSDLEQKWRVRCKTAQTWRKMEIP